MIYDTSTMTFWRKIFITSNGRWLLYEETGRGSHLSMQVRNQIRVWETEMAQEWEVIWPFDEGDRIATQTCLQVAMKLNEWGMDVTSIPLNPSDDYRYNAMEKIAMSHVRGCKSCGTRQYELAAVTVFSGCEYCGHDASIYQEFVNPATVDQKVAVMNAFSLGVYIIMFCRSNANFVYFVDKVLENIEMLANQVAVNKRGATDGSQSSPLPPLPPLSSKRVFEEINARKKVDTTTRPVAKWNPPRPRFKGAIAVNSVPLDEEEKHRRILAAVAHEKALRSAEEKRVEAKMKQMEFRKLAERIQKGV
jgi:hypothetical protein